MKHVLPLRCMICGATHDPATTPYVCPQHGDAGILDVEYDYEKIASAQPRAELARDPDATMWRYRALMPVMETSFVPPLRVGGTPLYPAGRLAEAVGLKSVWVKDEGLQPTGSLKDRASAMAVVKATERGNPTITTASSGNAAAALSGLCASASLRSIIFVPASAPPAKIAQMLAYGSTVLLVQGTYDEAFELCLAAAHQYGWYNRNTGYNPYMSEGKKTVSYEIAEQLNWQAPDVVLVSVGDGCIIGGVYKGFYDLLQLGWIDRMPRLIGVQAEGSAYLAEAWENGEDVKTKPIAPAQTLADSISVGLPRDRMKAMRAVVDSAGAFIRVPDEAMLEAIPLLARTTGVFAEPAGAASCAGLMQAAAQGLIHPTDRVVIINTGNGLKDIASVQRATQSAAAISIPTDLAIIEALPELMAAVR